MKNITVIILTYNEEIHIERCISSVSGLNCRVVVVDSFSEDRTCEIVQSLGYEVYKNAFVNQAVQFQWAMDNCQVDSDWVLRLDADETIDEVLTENINSFILNDGYGHNGGIFHRKHIFLGKWIRYGGRFPLPMLRLFRLGTAQVEQRWMDEHIVLDYGSSCVIDGGFEDNNLNSVSWFIDKHNKYATREVVDIMLMKLFPSNDPEITESTGFSIRFKRFLKQYVYMKLPYFLRPVFYFLFRYFFQLGFLDGSKGFAYHFMQGFWYRSLVDLKCIEVEKAWENVEERVDRIRVLEKITGYKLEDRL